MNEVGSIVLAFILHKKRIHKCIHIFIAPPNRPHVYGSYHQLYCFPVNLMLSFQVSKVCSQELISENDL